MKPITLRAARDKRNWTQEQLEAESGVDQGVISRLERGAIVNPTMDTVRKLEEALRLRPGSLRFGSAEAHVS